MVSQLAGLPVGQLTGELANQPAFINFAMSDEKRKQKFTHVVMLQVTEENVAPRSRGRQDVQCH